MACIRHIKGNTFCIETRFMTIPFYHLSEDQIILMDSGMNREQDELLTLLEESELRVRAVLTTHAHYDHVGSHVAFQKNHHAELYAGLLDAALMQDEQSLQAEFHGNSLREIQKMYPYMVMQIDHIIMPGQTCVCIDGASFRVIHLPGHAPDHLIFITPDEVAYLGDVLIGENAISEISMLFEQDLRSQLDSIRSLSQLSCDAYVLAHGGVYYEISGLQQINEAALLSQADNIRKLLFDWHSFEEILQMAATRLTRVHHSFGLYNLERILRCMLNYLLEEAMIEKRVKDGIFKYHKIQEDAMFQQLLSPKRIGLMELKNRMIVPAGVTRLANSDGTMTEAFIRYQEDKAKGGWAMIITEDVPIIETCKTYECLPGLWRDEQIDSHKEMTRRVHEAGAKICAQLYHAGRLATRKVNHTAPKAPSAVGGTVTAEIPEALSVEEIQELTVAYAQAARRAKEAGYDAVEIHGAHGYLIHQFLSSNTNKRSDAYGGSLINRNRFMLEVIEKVRGLVGSEYPVILRISADDYLEGGITIQESMVTARLAEKAGVDAIHCSAGTTETNFAIIPPTVTKRGLYVDNAAAIKSVVQIPVIAVGRINDPVVADNVIRSQKADFVGMFRASLADPEFPKKVEQGRLDEISYCVGCMQGCLGQNRRLEPFSCLVRPLTGHAHEWEIKPAETAKKVLVVGGGIAGCEAAVYAAMRGHKVTILEKSGQLGGRWNQAAVPPAKAELQSFLTWQQTMLEKYQVTVKLNQDVDAEAIAALAPDTVILASGGADVVPPISGIEKSHVVQADAVLKGEYLCKKNVVIVGGGLAGAETAEYLGQYYGANVTIVEMLPQIVGDGEPSPNRFLKQALAKWNVRILTDSAVKEIFDDSVIVSQNGQELSIPADTVVLAAGVRSEHGLAEELAAKGMDVRQVGDANKAKNGLKNIQEGFLAGIQI